LHTRYNTNRNTNTQFASLCNWGISKPISTKNVKSNATISNTAVQQTQYKGDQYQRLTITSIISHQHTKDSFSNQYWNTYYGFQRLRRISTATIKIRLDSH